MFQKKIVDYYLSFLDKNVLKEINRIVYKLYDLTDEEIQTIEAEK